MTIDFTHGSGFIDPSQLKTGDLLFTWDNTKLPVLFSKKNHLSTAQSPVKPDVSIEPPETVSIDSIKAMFSELSSLINKKSDNVFNHYSGHVAMVIVENDKPYIVEAGATDYANYRISINPYYVESEDKENNTFDTLRGWVNRRHAQKEKLWQARLVNPLTNTQKLRLVDYAKSLLGRPYGMLDSLKFADDSRIYCSDFVYKCYHNLGIELDDNRGWDWLLASPTFSQIPPYIELSEQPWIVFTLTLLLSSTFSDKVPALALPALFYSSSLQQINTVLENTQAITYGVE